MADVRDVLLDLGYKIQDHGREYRMSPLYRDSSSSSVLRVYKDTGWWTDFKENRAGPFEELVRLTLGLSDIEKAELVIIDEYLPELMSDDDIRVVIQEIVDGGTTDFGAVMGQAMSRLKGQADGNAVRSLVEQVLKS